MGRKSKTTLEEIEATIRHIDRPATPTEIAAHLDVPSNRVNQRLNADDGAHFAKTDGGAYYPRDLHPVLVTGDQLEILKTMRKVAQR